MIVAMVTKKRIAVSRSLSVIVTMLVYSGATTRWNTYAFSESKPPQLIIPIKIKASTLIQASSNFSGVSSLVVVIPVI